MSSWTGWTLAVGGMYAVAIPLYVWVLWRMQSIKHLRMAESNFYRGVTSVIDSSTGPSDATAQTLALYRRLGVRFPELSKCYRSDRGQALLEGFSHRRERLGSRLVEG